MRSMTGYGRGESDRGGVRISVEVNSVNRRQSDIVINLPRELAALEPRVRQAVSERVQRRLIEQERLADASARAASLSGSPARAIDDDIDPSIGVPFYYGNNGYGYGRGRGLRRGHEHGGDTGRPHGPRLGTPARVRGSAGLESR